MAKQFTGIDGALYADGNRVAKITNWSFQGNAEALETTTLGDFARTFVYGIQNYSGACTLLYYEEDSGSIAGNALLSDVMRTTQTPTGSTHEIELRYLNGAASHSVRFDCLLPTVAIAATVGGVVTAEVTFQATGNLKTSTI